LKRPASRASAPKKLIAVRSDLLDQIIEISNREGKTVLGLISEIFEQQIKAHEMNRSLSEIVDAYSLFQIARETGAVITQADALYYLTNKLYPSEKEILLEKWYGAGQWYGKYLLAKFSDEDPVEWFRKLLTACTWDITEAHVSRTENEGVRVRCVAPHMPRENTELLEAYLEGVMHSIGYKTRKKDSLKGIILLEFVK